jgi:Cu/Ag efflux protein CusF
MKKALMIALAVLISVAFVATVFAQAPAKPADKPAGSDKAPAAEKKADKKEKPKTFKGEVTKVDTTGKTITVKGTKGEETFDVSKVKNAEKFKEGNKVTVNYSEKNGKNVAKSAKMATDKKAAPKEKPEKAPGKSEAKPGEPAKK